MSRSTALVIAIGAITTACTGGGGSEGSREVSLQDGVAHTNEPADVTNEPAKNTWEHVVASDESPAGATGGSGSGSGSRPGQGTATAQGLDCSGTYTCVTAGKGTETLTAVGSSNGGCSISEGGSVVTFDADGHARFGTQDLGTFAITKTTISISGNVNTSCVKTKD